MLELLNETERRTLLSDSLAEDEEQVLVDAAFPLFLESGRQISLQFRPVEVWACR